jgi:hypothetical protein
VDESNLLAEESVVFSQFSTRFIFRSILKYLDDTWYRGTYDVTCMVAFRKRNNCGKEDFEFVRSNTQAYTLKLII